MRRFIIVISIIAAVATMSAQRRVTPVNNASTATQHVNENKGAGDSIDRSRLVELTDSKGNAVLVDAITGKEFRDTLGVGARVVPKMIYPLIYKASLSVDIFQGVMRAFGQHYGLVEFAAELNMHNRYLPVVEVGLGQAKNSPEDNNYTYSSPLSPFFRIGANYNFLYNSDPDYMVMAGVRYGFSPFKFSVTGITQPPGYWDEPLAYDIPSRSMTVGYFELLFGLRVKVCSNISMGWAVRYHQILHESSTPNGEPWYIPGFGARNGSIGGSFTITYTIPLARSAVPAVQQATD